MNDRIKQLAEQARINVSQKNYGYYWIESADGLEKFAELIVQECAKVADIADENKCEWIGGNILTHFGVEEALAQTEQEPVAWAMLHDNGHFIDAIHPDEHARVEGKYIHPLYTTEQRTWVGLTDEEIQTEWVLTPQNDKAEGIWFGRRIEAKLKEKNT